MARTSQKNHPVTSPTDFLVTKNLSDNVYPVRISKSPRKLGKDFKLLLAYALSLARQEDVAKAVSRSQGVVSRWGAGSHVPSRNHMPTVMRKLTAFVQRRSKKSAGAA